MVAPKHRRPKKAFIHFAIAAVAAVVVGVLGVALFMMVLGNLSSETQVAQEKNDELAKQVSSLKKELDESKNPSAREVRAVTRIPIGTIIEASMVEEAPLEGQRLNVDHFSRTSAVIGQLAALDILPGEALSKQSLLKAEGRLPVTAGMRAMAIMVNSVAGVGGAILPGSRVDILVTFDEDKMSRTLLQNVKVIATGDGGLGSSGSKDSPNRGGNIITVEVAPKDAEALALASQQGMFYLTLRNFTDEKLAKVNGTDMGHVITGVYAQDLTARLPQVKQPGPTEIPVNFTGQIMGLPQPAADTPSGRTFSMEIYKGSNSETQEFQWSH